MSPDDKLFHELIEQNSFGMIVTDLEGRITYVNTRRIESSGYCAEEMIGSKPSIFQSGLTSSATYQEMWLSILGGRPWKGEILNKRKNGEIVRESLLIQALLDEEGQVSGFSAIIDESFALRENHREQRTSIFDSLTGLPSLPSMLERLGSLLRGFQPETKGFTLLSIDIDGFQRFNDSLGRLVTDRVLIEVAARIQASIRRGDTVGRVDGDEFMVVLQGEHADTKASLETAARLLKAIAAPILIETHQVTLTASIGITGFPGDGTDAETLLGNAVAAMLAAKQEGGNQYCLFNPAMREKALGRLTMSAELRRDIERNDLALMFQPKVSLLSGEITGFEALVRWNHPERGLIEPRHFIAVAEETGLIVPLSEWVLRTALSQIKAWQDEGLNRVQISVNLSVRNLYQIDLPRLLTTLLADIGVDAPYLELELGESAMMRDALQSIRIVDRLRALGVQLSLDGFGTGYSSLAHLSRFEVSRLKIDRLFIEDITSNPVNASIVSAMIAMGHTLGKKLVAMGVESEAQMNFLRRQGCDEMQGFFFSKPCTAEEAAVMVREGKHLHFEADTEETELPTLLLVDDEPYILNSLKRLLRRENYRVLTATSGPEALEILALNPVRVVISDQRMPEMSGIELLSKVKSLYPDTVRIILSGYSELATVTDAINRGAVWKYLTKPWDDETLKEEVRKAFSV
ncbi:MAG TPA: EAL domain-containing protein [Rhodocyclaceae bacterium]|jgi:diguanylate cyclase (GGDEF)-like protein/PAS domain S-box-containing protein